MDILVRQARIIDPSSPFHQQTTNIFIQNGIVTEIGAVDRAADREIAVEGLCLSPGWTDIFSNFCDPGYESRETLASGARAAAAGGYTDVMVLPNTAPVLHNKSGIEYIVQRSASLPVSIHPVGAITKNTEGKELAEMYDMHRSGAVAFSDGTCTVQSAGLLTKALQYIKAINKTIIQLPDDRSVSASGLMNEGIVSTQLGLPGKPAMAEELMISRDIELAKYSGSRLHITGLSTARGLQLVKDAKAAGIAVTCSVTPHHLSFTDDDLVGYDTNLKLNPPVRTKSDRDALRQGLLDGNIDCIAAHHLPHDQDHKVVEFEYAQYGATSLETCFAAVRTAVPHLSLEQLVALFSTSPRKIFDLPQATVAVGAAARFSLFLPDAHWQPRVSQSRSKNTPFTGRGLTGKPLGIINQDKVFLSE
jgi:dihydroorotase